MCHCHWAGAGLKSAPEKVTQYQVCPPDGGTTPHHDTSPITAREFCTGCWYLWWCHGQCPPQRWWHWRWRCPAGHARSPWLHGEPSKQKNQRLVEAKLSLGSRRESNFGMDGALWMGNTQKCQKEIVDLLLNCNQSWTINTVLDQKNNGNTDNNWHLVIAKMDDDMVKGECCYR